MNNIIELEVPQHVIDDVDEFLKTHNIANRGEFDGNKENQKTGLIGESVVNHWLKGEYIDFSQYADGNDGGIDIIHNDFTIDVKTMKRGVFVQPDYVNNFPAVQIDTPTDIVVFASYNKKQEIIEVCGWIMKKMIKFKATYLEEGTKRFRGNDTCFYLATDSYEITNSDLLDITYLTCDEDLDALDAGRERDN